MSGKRTGTSSRFPYQSDLDRLLDELRRERRQAQALRFELSALDPPPKPSHARVHSDNNPKLRELFSNFIRGVDAQLESPSAKDPRRWGTQSGSCHQAHADLESPKSINVYHTSDHLEAHASPAGPGQSKLNSPAQASPRRPTEGLLYPRPQKQPRPRMPPLALDTDADAEGAFELAGTGPEVQLTSKRARLSFRRQFELHLDSVRFVKLAGAGALVSGGDDGLVKSWTAACDSKKAALSLNAVGRGHESPITCGAVLRRQLFTAGMRGEVVAWEVDDSRLVLRRKIKRGSEPIWGLAAVSPSVVVCSTPNLVRFVDFENQAKPFVHQTGSSHSFFGRVCAAGAGQFAVHSFANPAGEAGAPGEQHFIQLYDVNRPETPVHKFQHGKGLVNALEFCKVNKLLAVATESGHIVTLDARDRRLALCVKAHSGPVLSVALNETSGLLASAGLEACARSSAYLPVNLESSLRLWDLRKGSFACLNTYEKLDHKFDESILGLEFSQAGDFLFAAGADASLRVFDVEKLL